MDISLWPSCFRSAFDHRMKSTERRCLLDNFFRLSFERLAGETDANAERTDLSESILQINGSTIRYSQASCKLHRVAIFQNFSKTLLLDLFSYANCKGTFIMLRASQILDFFHSRESRFLWTNSREIPGSRDLPQNPNMLLIFL